MYPPLKTTIAHLLCPISFVLFTAPYILSPTIYTLLPAAAQTKQDREAEAKRLFEQGREQYGQGKLKEALATLQQAAVLFRQLGDRQQEWRAIDWIAKVYNQMEQPEKALESYQQALVIAREISDHNREGITLKYIGNVYQRLGQFAKALEYYQQALQLVRGQASFTEVYVLTDLGLFYEQLGEYPKAAEIFQQAASVCERLAEAASIQNATAMYEALARQAELQQYLGNSYIGMGDYTRAIESLQRNLANTRRYGNRPPRQVLISLANVYIALGDYTKAIDYLEEGLTTVRVEGNKQGELEVLSVLGSARVLLGDATGLQYLQASLPIARELRNKKNESKILNEIGLAYQNLGEPDKAIASFQQALAVYKQIGDQIGQAEVINNLGTTYINLGKYPQALELFQQALAIFQANNSQNGIGATVNNLGLLYRELGQSDRAMEFYQQALAIRRAIGNLAGQAATLHNIGLSYNDKQQYDKALSFYQQALAIRKNTGDLAGQATALNNIGLIQSHLGQFESAVQSLEQAIAIFRSLNNRAKEGNTLDSLGMVYRQAKQYEKALTAYEQALAILRASGNRATERVTLSNIGTLLQERNQPELAIVFYKQSVNLTEEIRKELRSLPREQQQSYTETVAETYRHLADLLLKRDRVLEAQQVLDLLKVQELDDYLRNVRGTGQQLTILRPEEEILKKFDTLQKSAIQLGQELDQLRTIPEANRTPAQQKRIEELVKLQEELSQQFNQFIDRADVVALLEQLSRATKRQTVDPADLERLRDDLRRLDAVLIYPLVLDERLELIVTTPESPPLRRTVNVKREDINRTIAQFRQALQDPSSDAKVPAQQLYTWLIEPLEQDLKQVSAKTIIYAPDGQLRYIPLAALHDGNQWLVQRYRINNITARSLTDLTTKSQPQLKILAGAFVQGNYMVQVGDRTLSFVGLPFAGREVENLATLLPNTTKLIDSAFSRTAITTKMNEYSVVHFATHAAFVPGAATNSFILFGNGETATLKDIENWSLNQVDMVVLSACETGIGGILGNGEEVLGLGYQFQSRGARAAIASLWQVDDGGTQALMNAFYTVLKSGNITKAEALQQAQLALIDSSSNASGQNRSSLAIISIERQLPSTVQSRLSHPYYWAPFILIGNGL